MEFASRLLLLLLALMSVPVALTAGTVVRAGLTDLAEQQAEDSTRTTAVTLADAASLVQADPDDRLLVPARWVAPAGPPVEGHAPAPVGTRAGDTVTIWTTPDGRRTNEPMTSVQATRVTVLVVGTGWIGSLLGIGAAHAGVHGLLGRHRDRRWTREWAAIEPTWSRRVP